MDSVQPEIDRIDHPSRKPYPRMKQDMKTGVT